jgi:ankyrin repeat protein
MNRADEDFLRAALVPRDAAHVSGDLAAANALLAAQPSLADASIHVAATLGDAERVRAWIARDATLATAGGGPYGWDPLTHLAFSRYLRLDAARSGGFVAAAQALLEAGASVASGFWEGGHEPRAVWESVLYGAAGVAHHPGVTQLLMDHGAEPNDEEVPYHAPEGWDNRALACILATGRLTADSLTMMLLRKSDWHDLEGMRLVLQAGGDANRQGRWGRTVLDHALRSDNALEMFELLVQYGADPRKESHGVSACAKAARFGRADVLALFERTMEAPLALSGADALLAACARGDSQRANRIAQTDALAVAAVREAAGLHLYAFALCGNASGLAVLLSLGLPVDAPYEPGEGYWDVAPDSTALHVAAWRGHHAAVATLVAAGADVHRRDGRGRTPLMRAVAACTNSYWMERRTPNSVRLLLEAGALAHDVSLPTGYDAIDVLLAGRR